MSIVPRLIVLSALVLLTAAPSFAAKVTTYGKNTWHAVASKQKRSVTYQVTNGYHAIKGWEQDVVKRDDNLRHWCWIPMLEADRSYLHAAPGSILPGTETRHKYLRPNRIAAGSLPRKPHNQVLIGQASPVSHYVKPNHVPTIIRHDMNKNTSARLCLSNPQGALSAPRTQIAMAAPKTNAQLRAPQVNAQLSAPQVNARLAAPQVSARLDAPRVAAKLAGPDAFGLLSSREAVGRLRNDPNGDIFSDPDAPSAERVYGQLQSRKFASVNYMSSSAQKVRGRLMSHIK